MEGHDLVFQFDDLGRLDKGCLACGRGVIDESLDLFLAGAVDRNQQLAVTHGKPGVLVHKPVGLCLLEDGVRPFGDRPLLCLYRAPDFQQLVRCRVLDIPELVQDLVDPSLYFRETQHRGAHPFEIGIYPVLYRHKEVGQLAHGLDHGAQLAQRKDVDCVAGLFQRLEEVEAVNVPVGREVFLEHHYKPHLVGQRQPFPNDLRVVAEPLLRHPRDCIFSGTSVGHKGSDPVKSQLALQSGVNLCFVFVLPHIRKLLFPLCGALFLRGSLASAEKEFKFIDVAYALDVASADKGYSSGFLRDNYHVSIGLLRDSDRRLVPHSVVRRNVGTSRDRQCAPRCDYPVGADDHRPVMQRGILEEYVHYQSPGDLRVHDVPGLDDEVERILAWEHDQRPGLVGGHGSARLGDLVDRASCHLLVLDAHKLVEEVAAFSGHPIARAELHQKVPHLGLEYDDERDHAHVDERPEQGAHQLHVECRHDHSQHEKQDDGDEYIHCRRPSYPPECQVDEYCDH